eukprot:TRINITY_DN3531_c0_g1_i1.p1 TRINITY_DN3531_c0_g1~~TRINITY_DN3531_c0_g1_i1.p1  ORF type:complete len:486 (-),score=112.71 TRINITY_DN3531_c0_g1_i1:77-1534(-)
MPSTTLSREREDVLEELLIKSPELRPTRNTTLSQNKNNSMRKYYKLFLVSLSLLSLLCFLFYKTQYDKLYNVLQVLEFYGNTPASSNPTKNNLPPCSNGSSSSSFNGQEDLSLEEGFHTRSSDPLPSWRRLHDGLWIYSAYCTSDPCSSVHGLALASKEALNLTLLTCSLWNTLSANGVHGILSFQRLKAKEEDEEDQLLHPYLLTCENKYPSNTPHALQLSTSQNVSIYTQIGFHGGSAPLNSLALCLAPQLDHSDSTHLMLENVLWHTTFGARNFYLYDSSSTGKFLSTLSSLGIRSSLTNLPWDLPHEVESRLSAEDRWTLLETDCHLRSVDKFLTFTLLELDQILVPGSADSLSMEFDSLIPKGSKHLRIPRLRFCAEFPENHEDVVVRALGINHYYAPLTSSISLVHGPPPPVPLSNSEEFNDSPKDISKNILSVHDYSPCNTLDIDLNSPDTQEDNTLITKFKTDFIKKYKHLFPHKDL